jgi:hypothetical protein
MKYQQNAANCMRLARETNDAVLSFGYMKMAQAWSDLEKEASPNHEAEATQSTIAAHWDHGRRIGELVSAARA